MSLTEISIDLEGVIKLNDKVISAKPIGPPIITYEQADINELRSPGYRNKTFEEGIERLARNYIEANAYCRGFEGKTDEFGSVSIPVQFYKI